MIIKEVEFKLVSQLLLKLTVARLDASCSIILKFVLSFDHKADSVVVFGGKNKSFIAFSFDLIFRRAGQLSTTIAIFLLPH